MTKTIDKPENSDETKTCPVCGSSTRYIDKSKEGFFPHWRIEPTVEKVR